jgi:hypothetical protein
MRTASSGIAILSAAVLLCALAATAFAGLDEKRAIAAYKQDMYPKQEAALREIVGADVAITVAWDELAVEGASALYADGFTKVYFEPLIAALASVAADDLGKEALAGALKSIAIRNSGKTSYATEGITFADGVLTVDLPPNVNIDQVESRMKLVKKAVEKAL